MILAESVRGAPTATYLIDGEQQYTFQEVFQRVERSRDRLAGLGIQPGDRVVLWLPNGLPWVVAFFALLHLGAIVVPAGTRLRAADLQHILADSGARALVYMASFLGIDFDRMAGELTRIRAGGGLPHLNHLIAVGPSALPGSRQFEGPSDPGPSSELEPAPADPAVACYTSGTTGRPKGCLHTHRSLVRNGAVAARLSGLRSGERITCPVPFAHVFGFHMGVLQAAISGSTLINAEPYSPEDYLDIAESRRATVAYAVPTMAREAVAAQARSPRQLSVRLALVAGAPVSASLRASVAGAGGIAEAVSIVYGCTEAPTISQLLPSDPLPQRQSSVGRPTPGMEVRIARPGTVQRLATGETGEILVRGYNAMTGYLGDPEATNRKFRDDWLVTGDLGSLDDDGYLYFVGRADDTMLVGGFNAHPRDIESQLETLDGIEEVAVIGVPDERLGEVPMAWVVGNPSLLDAGLVLRWCREHLASYKRPRYVQIVEHLPRVGSGKVARVRLLEQARRTLPALPWEELNR